jgi:hypothetical protein
MYYYKLFDYVLSLCKLSFKYRLLYIMKKYIISSTYIYISIKPNIFIFIDRLSKKYIFIYINISLIFQIAIILIYAELWLFF